MTRASTDSIVREWQPLAKRVARQLARKYNAGGDFEFQDIYAAVMGGLFDAARLHGDIVGDNFRRLALVRMKGAVKDWFRSCDRLPRGGRAWASDYVWLDIDDPEHAQLHHDDEYEAREKLDRLSVLIGLLEGERNRDVIIRTIRGETQEEIGVVYGVSYVRIGQLISRSARRLREAYVERAGVD